jgi:23S rRNA pseudouridine1911/1915/1917 synthase
MIEMKKDGEWLVGTLTEGEEGVPFGPLLRDVWGFPRKLAHLLFQHKEIMADGHAVTQMQRAAAGQELRLRVCLPEPFGVEPIAEPIDVLYEDDHLLVVNKPAGLLLHPTEAQHMRTLDHLVAGHFAKRGLQAKVRHVHRLDQDTSGAVLYAKHALAAALLDERLRRREIKRHYHAFVHGIVAKEAGTIDAAIGRDRHVPGRRRAVPQGESAVTHYRVVSRYKQATHVACQLETGRTHQIRVHLSHIGHPLIGDTLYGGRANGISRQALHARELQLVHPFGEQPISTVAAWPEDIRQLERFLRQR